MSEAKKVRLELIKELRTMIPIGILDAKTLLKNNQLNLEKSRSEFIHREVKRLCELHQEEEELVSQIFFACDYDPNITTDRIHDVKFDRQYSNLLYKSTKHDLNMVDAWLLTVYSHGLMNSLQTADFESVVLVVKEIGLPRFARELESAHDFLAKKEQEFRTFEEDKLLMAVEDLKNTPEYQSILESFKMKVTLNPDFFKVLNRLKRNVM